MPALKGSAWLVNFEFIKEKFGPNALEKVLQALNTEDRQLLSKFMVAASWGPDFSLYMRFILTADKILGKGNMALLPEACAYHFKRDTKLYSLFFKILSTELVFKNVPKIWGTYFKPAGEFKTIEIGPKHFQFTLTGFQDLPLYHDVYHSQYLVEILKVTGVKKYKSTHVNCTARGDLQCLWDITWE